MTLASTALTERLLVEKYHQHEKLFREYVIVRNAKKREIFDQWKNDLILFARHLFANCNENLLMVKENHPHTPSVKIEYNGYGLAFTVDHYDLEGSATISLFMPDEDHDNLIQTQEYHLDIPSITLYPPQIYSTEYSLSSKSENQIVDELIKYHQVNLTKITNLNVNAGFRIMETALQYLMPFIPSKLYQALNKLKKQEFDSVENFFISLNNSIDTDLLAQFEIILPAYFRFSNFLVLIKSDSNFFKKKYNQYPNFINILGEIISLTGDFFDN